MNNKIDVSFEEKIKESMKSVKPEPQFRDNLWQKIVQNRKENTQRKPLMKILQPVLFSLLGVFTITVVVVFTNPHNIALALSKLRGYLPGIGFVQSDTQVLYLESPISVEDNGIIFNLDQVWSDENNVIINYRFLGLSNPSTCSYINNYLLLPNGMTLLPISGGSVSGTESAQKQLYFHPLPKDIRTFTLVVGNEKEGANACNAPDEWQMEVVLKPLPSDMTFGQVLLGKELQVNTAGVVTPETQLENESYFNPSSITVSIDRVAVLEDSYVVAGHFDLSNPDPKNLSISGKIDYADIKVTDALGSRIPIEESDNDLIQDNGFVFKFENENYKNPISIEFQSVIISVHIINGDSFSFEAGQHPFVGQTWQVNQKMNLIGYEFNIDSVKAFHDNSVSDDPNEVNGYAIRIYPIVSDILYINFSNTSDQIHTKNVLGNIIEGGDGSWTLEETYPDLLPKNYVTYKASRIITRINHSWELQMTLP